MTWNGALAHHQDLRSVCHVPRDVVLGERRPDPVGQLLEVCQIALDGGTFTRSTYGNSVLPAAITNGTCNCNDP
eukprot:5625675-Pyramimonas_sp.AAC.2